MIDPETAQPDGPRPLRADQKQFTRDRLVKAAFDVFERDGYANATVESIVTAAGASRATFYVYFTNKLEALRAVQEEMERMGRGDGVMQQFSEMVPDRAHVRGWLEQLLPYWVRYGRLSSVINYASMSDPDVATAHHAVQERHLAGLIDALSQHRPMDAGEARVVATLLITQLIGFCRAWIVEKEDFDHDVAMEALTDSWLAAIHADRLFGRAAADADELPLMVAATQ